MRDRFRFVMRPGQRGLNKREGQQKADKYIYIWTTKGVRPDLRLPLFIEGRGVHKVTTIRVR